MTETSQTVEGKPLRKLALEEVDLRQDLLAMLNRVMEESFGKFRGRYCRNAEKLQWARVLGLLAQAANSILKDVELEDLLARIERLERGDRGETHAER